MIKLTFDCTLLSDIILNVSSATSGNTDSLDYIPGTKFLGIVAKQQYKNLADTENSILDIFYNGNVRFGDAHLVADDIRSLKIPLDYFHEKGESQGKHWIHHKLTTESRNKNKENKIQLKQRHKGYFTFTKDTIEGKILEPRTQYSLKSAYDAKNRKSADQQMYGYNAVRKGSIWRFTVEIDSIAKDYANQITNSLLGVQRIGKSRSAEYGQVKIEKSEKINFGQSNVKNIQGDITLYAESNLCFVDKYGQFTVKPTIEDLGFECKGNDGIDWTKSQIKHRIYAPRNGKRSARDYDRWIIEKGSVIFLKNVVGFDQKKLEKGVGLFRAEGFGKLLVNPDFLMKEEICLVKYESASKENKRSTLTPKNELIKSLVLLRKKMLSPDSLIAKKVADFIRDEEEGFKEISPSQWGQIRNIVQYVREPKHLEILLFNTDVGFLYTAKRKNVWSKQQRAKRLEKAALDDELQSFKEKKDFLTALAAEMAKKNKSNGQ